MGLDFVTRNPAINPRDFDKGVGPTADLHNIPNGQLPLPTRQDLMLSLFSLPRNVRLASASTRQSRPQSGGPPALHSSPSLLCDALLGSRLLFDERGRSQEHEGAHCERSARYLTVCWCRRRPYALLGRLDEHVSYLPAMVRIHIVIALHVVRRVLTIDVGRPRRQ